MDTTIINNTFLNSLFTAKEFEFIKSIDSDSAQYDQELEKEIAYRDSIVTFINTLREKMVKGEEFDESDNLSELLKKSQECFDKVNDNIKAIQGNKEYSDIINSQIVELLISTDSQSDSLSTTDFNEKASHIKDEINSFSEKIENTKSIINDNDNYITQFLNQENVQKYIPITQDEETSIANDNTRESDNSNLAQIISDEVSNVENLDITESIKENNDTLIISEKDKMVYLPYSKNEVLEYLKQYPKQYNSFGDVVKQEYIFNSDFYMKHPAIARFRETYALIRDRESKTIIDAFKFAMDTMFQHDLNPTIIAACKSQSQLENYIKCLEHQKLEDFTDFKIKFEVNPLKV